MSFQGKLGAAGTGPIICLRRLPERQYLLGLNQNGISSAGGAGCCVAVAAAGGLEV
jgi:hypothetical protein